MFYAFSVPIPANTPATSPVDVEAVLTYGIIDHIEMHIPAGCAGLTHLKILQALHQVWPTNEDANFAADNINIVWGERFELFEPPYTLTLRAWNLDDTYPHTLIVRFGLYVPSKTITERFMERILGVSSPPGGR